MLRNHPAGLKTIFFTEMWERFGFYTLMAILVLYMDKNFGWTDAHKGDVYGGFLGAVYFIPILGGWIGDRLLGPRNTIKTGAILMAAGYTALAVSSIDRLAYFYIGLFLVAFGTGIFKVNMSVLVGNLYEHGDPRKDAGFNIYYMGVNVGAMIAPLAATIISVVYHSYNLSFVASACGMILSITIFTMGGKSLVHSENRIKQDRIQGSSDAVVADPKENRQRVVTLAILFTIVIFFWVAFYQNGFALTLFAERSTLVLSFLKPETYQFFPPFFIIVLTPIVIRLFSFLREKGREPSSPVKIFWGMFISGFSMIVMIVAGLLGGNLDRNIMSPYWLISSYFIVEISEILVSPMGQSFVSKVAPRRIQGLMMGFWFSATAIGSYGSGLLGRFYGRFPHHQYFFILTVMLFLSSGLVLVFLKKLKRFST